ncbi:unnamed protein product [Moneuplotes crassus]|uniref:Uncharacterized protein n=1 Tax=Euplotes crassus TaxID=5936 RepID=A0AAD1XL81_EUPCR|nr:unnamed protein product [Moneuplotes crassus]
MGKNKDMNPVMKMRKKQKMKEREKRREIKQKEDDFGDSYNPNAINELKNHGNRFDKTDKEHYQQNPLTWQQLQSNLYTGNINRLTNDSYGYQQEQPAQGFGNGGYTSHDNYGRNPAPQWQGDSLTSQPILYNGAPEDSKEPSIPKIPSLMNQPPKLMKENERRKMNDEFDPLNPNKAKRNFKLDAYKTPEELAAEENPPPKPEPEPEKEKSDDEKEKPDPMTTSNFVPSAVRRRKNKKKAAKIKSQKVEEAPKQEEAKKPEEETTGIKPILPPGMMVNPSVKTSEVDIEQPQEIPEIPEIPEEPEPVENKEDEIPDIAQIPDLPSENDSSGSDNDEDAMAALMGRY